MALAFSRGAGTAPAATCRFSLEGGAGTRRDFLVGCPNASAASDACFVTDRWFTPYFSVYACFRINAWLADIACPEVCRPVWPACWLDTPDRSSSSAARVVQGVWDVYREELGVVRDAVSRSSVDDVWSIWCRVQRMGCSVLILGLVDPLRLAAPLFLVEVCSVFVAGVWEVGLLVAVVLVGCIGPVMGIRLMCIVLSTLSTLLVLFRRRLKSVADVLKGIKDQGFTSSRWNALQCHWEAVCRHGPCGPISSLDPWDKWILPDLHGFYKLVFDSLKLLNDFLRQVVVNRRDIGIRKWTRWLREDLRSRPCAWLTPDFIPPSPILVVKDPQTQSSRILVEPHLTDAEFRRAWMPFFSVGLVIPLLLLISSWILLVIFLPQESLLHLPRITGRDLLEVAWAKKSTAGGLDGWAWNEIKALPLPWFSGLAILLELVETSGIWPQGLLDAFFLP